ncbi:transposase [Candidatus Amesbacteria bacterium]|nr:transposase [Candidatus Amesbacteria bacterium]
MPAKNSIKEFIADSYYHIYNRGVEKRRIFVDEQDHGVFLKYLGEYLTPKDEAYLRDVLTDFHSSPKQKADAAKMLKLNNFSDTVTLLAYCQMPNHFHLLVKQTVATSIDSLMNSFSTRYSMYFNKRYKRVGHLFQGTYKAVLVKTEAQLLHLTRYIHKNPASKGVPLQSYPHSSYKNYLNMVTTGWVKPNEILNHFAKTGYNSYREFVESNIDYDSQDFVKELILDE